MADAPRLVLGLQPVREAIAAHGRRLAAVWVDRRGEPRLDAVARFATDQGVADVKRVAGAELDRVSRGTAHQGVAAWAPELFLQREAALLERDDLIAVALDGIQDPQNFGAVVRSAVAMAGAAVVWPEHGSAPLTPATFRASAGAIEHATLCRVRTLAGFLLEARGAGAQVVGLDAQAPVELGDLELTRPTIVVLGSEHTGMGRAVRRACTSLARLVEPVHLDSLNASAAAAIALYVIRKKLGIFKP
ncbi:MAG: RNA methyltransferase [Polyangiaceae bacterium]|nr:RNA methyltransferase [Polyangiaceae bacterium]